MCFDCGAHLWAFNYSGIRKILRPKSRGATSGSKSNCYQIVELGCVFGPILMRHSLVGAGCRTIAVDYSVKYFISKLLTKQRANNRIVLRK